MKNRLTILITGIFFFLFNSAFAQDWDWARSIFGPDNQNVLGVKADNLGSVYITGRYQGTINFPDTFFVGNATYDDGFIARYDDQGNYKWARRFGGNANDAAYTLTTDSLGFIYVAGYSRSTNPVVYDTFSFTGTGNDKTFLLKIDSLGNLVWGKLVTQGTSNAYPVNISVNNNNQLILSGNYAFVNLTIETTTLTLSGSDDIFIAMFDSDDGDLAWAKSASGTYIEGAAGAAIDENGTAYLGGIFNGAITIGGTINITALGYEGFLCKFDSLGNALWAKEYSGTGDDFIDGIAINPAGEIFICGWYGSGNHVLNDTTISTLYVNCHLLQKVLPDGSSAWTREYHGNGTGRINGIAVDQNSDVYLAGYLGNTMFFDSFVLPGLGNSNYQNFIARISATGTVLIAEVGGNYISPGGNDYVSCDNLGNAYVVGFFGNGANNEICVFGNDSLTNQGAQDGYLAKYNSNFTINCFFQPQLSVSDTSVCYGDVVYFDLSSQNSSYDSLFINGNFISSADIGLTLPAGSYSAYLVAGNGFCSDTSTTETFEIHSGTDINLNPIEICQGESALIFGVYQSAAGVYTQVNQNSFGCDSIVHVTLIVNPINQTNLNDIEICEGDSANIFGTWYDVSGNHSQTYQGSNSCDSIVSIDLIVHSNPNVSFSGLPDTLCTNDNAITLTGNPAGGIFSGNGISGNSFDPASAGIGSHQITYSFTDINGCSGESTESVYVKTCGQNSVHDLVLNSISIFPIPANELCVVSCELCDEESLLTVYDAIGRKIYSAVFSGGNCTLPTVNWQQGVYFVEVRNGNEKRIVKVVKM